jgi:hypothetical protein
MFIIVGTRFLSWGAEKMGEQTRCARCGQVSHFTRKKGMNFITLFFIIPIFPLSGVKHIAQCPNCKARYEVEAPVA